MRDDSSVESQVLDYATAPERRPPKLLPYRVMGVIGIVYFATYATMVIRDPDNHEKPLEIFGVAIAFLFSAIQLVIKPRKRG